LIVTNRVADLLVETLEAAGVKTCYGMVRDTLNRAAHAN
jgi:pyruvate dehydrogenase (quinone)